MRKFKVKHSIFILLILLISCTSEKPYEWQVPDNFPLPNIPADNPMTYSKIALGRALFFEPALSGNGAMSCSTCHQPEFAFSEPRAKSSGSTGIELKRNALALINVAYSNHLTWAHNQIDSIEQQMMIPLFSDSPAEMGVTGSQEVVLSRFNTEDYRNLFEDAWGDDDITFDRIVKSIASFVRSLTSFNSAFDDYAYRGLDNAMSESAIRGLELFFSERLECFHCHGGFNFTQSSKHQFQPIDLKSFHNTGLYNVDGKGSYPKTDRGLIETTFDDNDMGRFKAPTLRNIALTSPYMHDGSLETLDDVIAFYAAGGSENGKSSPLKSPFIKGFVLTEQEHQDLLAFLASLTDDDFVNRPDNHAPINPPKVNAFVNALVNNNKKEPAQP